jgi:asparagine synthase (glutamine-hydrolysing)
MPSILDFFHKDVEFCGDSSPGIVGFLPNGKVNDSISKLEAGSIELVMGAISLQELHVGSDSITTLEVPDGGKIVLLLDSTLDTFQRLYSKRQDFSDSIDLDLKRSESIHSSRNLLVERISSWSRDFSSGFVFAMSDRAHILVSRDLLGLRQVFLGENNRMAGFATEKSLLGRLGFSQVIELELGGTVCISQDGVVNRERMAFPPQREHKDAMDVSAEELSGLLCRVLTEELSAYDSVGVAFSGGVDSSILARVASLTDTEVQLYTAGVVDSEDLVFAEKAAGWLSLPLTTIPLSIDDFESDLIEVVSLLGTEDLMALSIALPIYVSHRAVRNNGFSTVISGQGADEVFGGYFRHLESFREDGYSGVSRSIWEDVNHLCARNVAREREIAKYYKLDLLLPYLNLDIIRAGLEISPSLKILGPEDSLRKAVLRESGRLLGLPQEVVYRKKRAVQYSSGSLKILRRLAKKQGYSTKQYLHYLREKQVSRPQKSP